MDTTSRLAALEPTCTATEAVEFFDQLPAVRSEDILGQWKGRELATGHPMDGMLAASGWYGKRFDDVESVHPLVFRSPSGKFWFGEPRKMPMGAAAHISNRLVEAGRQRLSPLIEHLASTGNHRARLRNVEYRGVVSAAMVYDHLPIIDVFRQVDDRTLLGIMDKKGMEELYFFILQRDDQTHD